MDTKYEPGEVRIVAYNADGSVAGEKTMRTAGKPHHLVVSSNRDSLMADGDDLAYLTVQVADKDGNIVPGETRRVKFKVTGAGEFEATTNGDPTCVLPFTNPEMDLFAGAATAIVRAGKTPGKLTFTATAKGLKPAIISLIVK